MPTRLGDIRNKLCSAKLPAETWDPPQWKSRWSLWLTKSTFPLRFNFTWDPNHVLVTTWCNCPEGLSHMTILWFSNEMSHLQKWPPGIDSLNSLIRIGVLIGAGNAFHRRRFWFTCYVLYYCCDYLRRTHRRITRSHIRWHENTRECAETAGYTLM